MERSRILEEVVEIIYHKLHCLPPWGEDPDFDYEAQRFVPDITENPLDIAEVAMDIEDSFGIAFEEEPGSPGLESIGAVADYIDQQLSSRYPAA